MIFALHAGEYGRANPHHDCAFWRQHNAKTNTNGRQWKAALARDANNFKHQRKQHARKHGPRRRHRQHAPQLCNSIWTSLHNAGHGAAFAHAFDHFANSRPLNRARHRPRFGDGAFNGRVAAWLPFIQEQKIKQRSTCKRARDNSNAMSPRLLTRLGAKHVAGFDVH